MRMRAAILDALVALTVFIWLGAASDVIAPNPAYAVGWYEYCWTLPGTCPGTITTCTGCVPGWKLTGSCGTTSWPWYCGGGGCTGTNPPGCSCNINAC
jgi:hypothetical protein